MPETLIRTRTNWRVNIDVLAACIAIDIADYDGARMAFYFPDSKTFPCTVNT